MIYTIDEIKHITAPIIKTYGITKVCFFGSYAKGTAKSSNDIDFIIDKGDLIGIKCFSLLEDLENAFKCKFDLITTG